MAEPYIMNVAMSTLGPPTCGTNANFGFGPLRPRDAFPVWEVHAELRQATLESIQMVVDWKRLVAGPDGAVRKAAGDRREITLGEGQRHLLDFAEVPTCLKSLALELSASIEEDPERAAGPTGAVVSVERTGELPVVRVSGVVDEGAAEHLRIRLLEASRGGTALVRVREQLDEVGEAMSSVEAWLDAR